MKWFVLISSLHISNKFKAFYFQDNLIAFPLFPGDWRSSNGTTENLNFDSMRYSGLDMTSSANWSNFIQKHHSYYTDNADAL